MSYQILCHVLVFDMQLHNLMADFISPFLWSGTRTSSFKGSWKPLSNTGSQAPPGGKGKIHVLKHFYSANAWKAGPS